MCETVPRKEEVSVDVQLIDENELIYHTKWPRKGLTSDLYENLIKSAKFSDPVHIIFDKYYGESVKIHERLWKADGQAYSDVELTSATQLPTRDIIINNDKNKTLIINLLCSKQQGDHKIQMTGEEQKCYIHLKINIIILTRTHI